MILFSTFRRNKESIRSMTLTLTLTFSLPLFTALAKLIFIRGSRQPRGICHPPSHLSHKKLVVKDFLPSLPRPMDPLLCLTPGKSLIHHWFRPLVGGMYAVLFSNAYARHSPCPLRNQQLKWSESVREWCTVSDMNTCKHKHLDQHRSIVPNQWQ